MPFIGLSCISVHPKSISDPYLNWFFGLYSFLGLIFYETKLFYVVTGYFATKLRRITVIWTLFSPLQTWFRPFKTWCRSLQIQYSEFFLIFLSFTYFVALFTFKRCLKKLYIKIALKLSLHLLRSFEYKEMLLKCSGAVKSLSSCTLSAFDHVYPSQFVEREFWRIYFVLWEVILGLFTVNEILEGCILRPQWIDDGVLQQERGTASISFLDQAKSLHRLEFQSSGLFAPQHFS